MGFTREQVGRPPAPRDSTVWTYATGGRVTLGVVFNEEKGEFLGWAEFGSTSRLLSGTPITKLADAQRAALIRARELLLAEVEILNDAIDDAVAEGLLANYEQAEPGNASG